MDAAVLMGKNKPDMTEVRLLLAKIVQFQLQVLEDSSLHCLEYVWEKKFKLLCLVVY